MLPGILQVKVTGLWIPRGRRTAIERSFYLCAHPSCLTRKPPFSNLRVPPTEIKMSVNSFLSKNDIATERVLPLPFPVDDLFETLPSFSSTKEMNRGFGYHRNNSRVC